MKSLRLLLELEKLSSWTDDQLESKDFEFFEILLRSFFIEALDLKIILNCSHINRILKGIHQALKSSSLYNKEFLGIYILRYQILEIWREEDSVLGKIWQKEVVYHSTKKNYRHWFDQWIYKKFSLDQGINIQDILSVIELWGKMLDSTEEIIQKRTFLYSLTDKGGHWEDVSFSYFKVEQTRKENHSTIEHIFIREEDIEFILSFEKTICHLIIPKGMENKIYELEVYNHNSDIILKTSYFKDLIIALPLNTSYFFINRTGAFILQKIQLLGEN